MARHEEQQRQQDEQQQRRQQLTPPAAGSGNGGGGLFGMVGMLKTAATRAAAAVRSTVRRETVVQFPSRTVLVDAEPFAEGGFCTVYRAHDADEPERRFALKWMVAQEQAHLEECQWEVEVHRRLAGSPHIMELHDHLVRPSQKVQNSRAAKDVLLLYPLCEGGSLFNVMERALDGSVGAAVNDTVREGAWPFPERVALTHFLAACAGLRRMHKLGLLHRDIKPHNILLFDGTAVVMDLGSTGSLTAMQVADRRQAAELQDECNSKCSPPYRAPELHDPDPAKPIDGRADVFSLGCTLYALAFGYNPFEHPRRGFEKLALLNGNVQFPEDRRNRFGDVYSKGFCALVKATLRPDPKKRMKLSRAIKTATGLLEGE